MTAAEYIKPIRYTPASLATMIVRTGIGIDSRKSLSLARYRLEKVLKTLPKVPRTSAIMLMTTKYSQPMSASTSPPQSAKAVKPKEPPRTPKMITK